jgi:biotin carboxylase
LGLRQGPIHGELRVNDAGVWLIELAARSIGGRCSRTLRFAAGLSLEEIILRHALGLALPELDEAQQPAGVMMLPIPKSGVFQEILGQLEALAVPGVEELVITAQPGEELVPLPEGTRYLGFLIARGNSAEQVEATLRAAHRRLEVIVNRRPTIGAITF